MTTDPRRCARELVSKHHTGSAPVPAERIVKALGVVIEYGPLDEELSGLAYIREGVSIIGVNSLHAPTRQRFTIAHELGHICLHGDELKKAVHVDKGSLRRDPTSAMGTDPLEVQANAFASEFLMPETLLEAALAGKPIDLEDDDAIAALAKKFRVSEAAMRYRLQLKG